MDCDTYITGNIDELFLLLDQLSELLNAKDVLDSIPSFGKADSLVSVLGEVFHGNVGVDVLVTITEQVFWHHRTNWLWNSGKYVDKPAMMFQIREFLQSPSQEKPPKIDRALLKKHF